MLWLGLLYGQGWGLYSAVSGTSNFLPCLCWIVEQFPRCVQLIGYGLIRQKSALSFLARWGHQLDSADGQSRWLISLLECCCEEELSLPRSQCLFLQTIYLFQSDLQWSSPRESSCDPCKVRPKWACWKAFCNIGGAGCLPWVLLFPLEK